MLHVFGGPYHAWNFEDCACRPDLTAKQAAGMQCSARDAVSDEDIEEAAYFSKYAFAAYGYMLYIWSKPQFKCAF